MARIRTVKPEFWQDEKIGELTPLARLLFIGCWNLADDEGLLKLNPLSLKSQIFPYDDISAEDSKNILGELLDLSLVFQYKDQKNQVYGWIPNFRKHQRIDKPQAAKHPLPSLQNPEIKKQYAMRDDFICHVCGEEIVLGEPELRRKLSLDHIKPRSKGGLDTPTNIKIAHFGCNASKKDSYDSENIPGTVSDGKERKGKEGKGTGKGKELSPPAQSIPFDIFWNRYPRKTNKQKAEAAWKKLNPSEGLLNEIIQNIDRRLLLDEWSCDRKDFIPHASTFLNGRRWEDEIVPKTGGSNGYQQLNQPSSLRKRGFAEDLSDTSWAESSGGDI